MTIVPYTVLYYPQGDDAMVYEVTEYPYHHNIQIQNLSHMLLVIALSFVKLFVTFVEILIMHP